MYYANTSFKNFTKISCALLLCAIVSVSILSSTKINIRSSKDLSKISSYLSDESIANNSIINFSSWGGYLQQSIYGYDTQIVTMTNPINRDLATKVNNLRIDKDRNYIINIFYKCSLKKIKQTFPSAKNIEFIELKTNIWKVIKISYD